MVGELGHRLETAFADQWIPVQQGVVSSLNSLCLSVSSSEGRPSSVGQETKLSCSHYDDDGARGTPPAVIVRGQVSDPLRNTHGKWIFAFASAKLPLTIGRTSFSSISQWGSLERREVRNDDHLRGALSFSSLVQGCPTGFGPFNDGEISSCEG